MPISISSMLKGVRTTAKPWNSALISTKDLSPRERYGSKRVAAGQ
jgi:hypothetical protein